MHHAGHSTACTSIFSCLQSQPHSWSKDRKPTHIKNRDLRVCIFTVVFPLATLQLARLGKQVIPSSSWQKAPLKSMEVSLQRASSNHTHSSQALSLTPIWVQRSGLVPGSWAPCSCSIGLRLHLQDLSWWQESCVAARNRSQTNLRHGLALSPCDSSYRRNKFCLNTNRRTVNLLVWHSVLLNRTASLKQVTAAVNKPVCLGAVSPKWSRGLEQWLWPLRVPRIPVYFPFAPSVPDGNTPPGNSMAP